MPSRRTRFIPASAGSRSGIALVVVLGFLAVLVIMAMGFAVSMRVERLAARNSLDHVRSRQLGEAALARVVSDIQKDLGSALVPDWAGSWVEGAFESIGSGVAMTNKLIEGHVTNYIPRSLWTAAHNAEKNAQWLPFEYTDAGGQQKRIGRYAYIVLDCSGLLDVNFDYTSNNIPMPRRLGASPYELQLALPGGALIGEMSVNNARWTNMIWGRTTANSQTVESAWTRLETVAEISPMLARGFGNMQPLSPASVQSSNLITYSRFPRGWLANGGVRQPIYIGDLAAIQANKNEIIAQFGEMGYPEPITSYDNLVDYVDTDNQPWNRSSFCTEAVPMLNEIVVSNRIITEASETHITNEYQILVELWYPFTSTNANSYSVRLGAIYEGMSPPELNPPAVNETIPIPISAWTVDRYVIITSTLRRAAASGVIPETSQARVRILARVQEGAVLTEVDTVGSMTIPIGVSMTDYGTYMRGKACKDPRMNWDGSDDNQWKDVDSPTLRAFNAGVADPTVAGADGSTLMYVRNGPLQAVGELGLMLYDKTKPWTTVGLLEGANFFPVLNRFTTKTNAVLYGLVNPNSWNTNVVGTVFLGSRVERVPFDPQGTNTTLTQARDIARAMVTMASVTNVADLGNMSAEIAAGYGNLDPMRKESVLRNSAGLFSPRQNLFTVILISQVTDDEDNVLAEQRGVGTIWRDPYPVNGRHEVFVRYYRWLTE